MEKNILNKENLSSCIRQVASILYGSDETLFNGSIVLADKNEKLEFLTIDEAKNAIDNNVQICLVSNKTVDFEDGKNAGKLILVPEKDIERIKIATSTKTNYDYKVCISPLYKETLYQPRQIKEIIATL